MDLELLLWQTLWLLAPMGIANMMPVFAAKLASKYSYPIDGYRSYNGQPLFGVRKTYRGIIAGIIGGAAIFLAQQWLYDSSAWIRQISLFNYPAMTVWYGFLAGSGALTGDLIKSFFKRRVGIAPGRPWFPFDQVDYLIGGLMLTSWLFWPGLSQIAALLVLGIVLHIMTNKIGKLLRLRP
ncbi:MAG: CDP-archaeol synthase [bacterium]